MRETANRRHSVLNVANNWIAISNRRKISVYRTRRVWFGSIRCVRSLIIPFQNACRTKPLNSINLSAFARKSWAMPIYLNFFWRSKRNNFSLGIFLLIQSSPAYDSRATKFIFKENYESFLLNGATLSDSAEVLLTPIKLSSSPSQSLSNFSGSSLQCDILVLSCRLISVKIIQKKVHE